MAKTDHHYFELKSSSVYQADHKVIRKSKKVIGAK